MYCLCDSKMKMKFFSSFCRTHVFLILFSNLFYLVIIVLPLFCFLVWTTCRAKDGSNMHYACHRHLT